MLAHAVTAIGRRVGRRDGAPQVEAGGQGASSQRFIGPALAHHQLVSRLGLCQRRRAADHAFGRQRGAAHSGTSLQCGGHRRLRQVAHVQLRAWHQQRRFGGVVVQGAGARAVGVNAGLTGHHCIQPVAFQFGRMQHRAAAVGNAYRDDAGVVEGERCGLRIRLPKRQQRELSGLLHMAAPVGLRVVLGVRVLERHARGVDRRVRHEGQISDFAQGTHGAIGTHAHLRIEIVVIAAGALVGVDHRTALGQAPGRRHRYRAVDAARTGGRCDQHAALAQIEVVRHLCQHAVRLFGVGQSRIGRVFATRRGRQAAKQFTVTTARRQVGNAAPAAPQRASAQFFHRRCTGVGEGRRRHAAQARQAQASGEQIVAAAMFAAEFVAEHGRLHGLGCGTAGTGGQAQSDD
ncbi:hypothetical protein D3C71_1076540 [compost metagenome]